MSEISKLIEEIVELCYQQKKVEAYNKLNFFIGELAKLMVEFSEDKVKQVNEILKDILAAMEEDDIVAIADLMEYELKEKIA